MNKIPFLFPLLGLASGIFLNAELIPGIAFATIALAIAFFIWIIVYTLTKNPLKGPKYTRLHLVWVFFLFLGLGALDFNFRSSFHLDEEIDGRNLTFTGKVTDIKYLSDGDRLQVEIKGVNDSLGRRIGVSNLSMLVKTDGFLVSKGNLISFRGKANKISNIGKFENSLLHRGISYRANIKQNRISVTGEDNSIFSPFERLKESIIIRIEKSSLNRDTGDFLTSILLGDKTFLRDDTRQTLSSAGMAHVLALSGMHVGIILSILLALLFPLSLAGYPKTRYLIAILFLWIYVAITGGAPSTVRAAIMATLLLGAILLERKNGALNSLMVAAFLILLISPYALWDIGFQLSFLCVLGIILFVRKVNPIDHRKHPVTYRVVEAICVTTVATLFTWTVTAYYFGTVPLLFLLSNFILLPLLPAFVGAGLLYILLLIIGIDFIFPARLLDYFHDFFVGTADKLSFSGSAVLNMEIPLFSVILWLLSLLFIAFSIYSITRRKAVYAFVSAGVMLIVSVTLMITLENTSKESLKFKHGFAEIIVQHKGADKINNLSFPRRSISSVSTPDFQIITIDAPLRADALQDIKPGNKPYPLFIIAGSEADFNQIADLMNGGNVNKVILHSGVGKNKKAELLRLIDESDFDKVYSLRENGSLEFPL